MKGVHIGWCMHTTWYVFQLAPRSLPYLIPTLTAKKAYKLWWTLQKKWSFEKVAGLEANNLYSLKKPLLWNIHRHLGWQDGSLESEHGKGIWKSMGLYIGTWNIQTQKHSSVHSVKLTHQLDITALQEIWWPGLGLLTKDIYTLSLLWWNKQQTWTGLRICHK